MQQCQKCCVAVSFICVDHMIRCSVLSATIDFVSEIMVMDNFIKEIVLLD